MQSGKTADDSAAGWEIKKRDGTVVPFDCRKIGDAVSKCFAAIGRPDDGLAERVVWAVVNRCKAEGIGQPCVEDVQRLVLQKLWGDGLFEAGEQYQNYRESRRKDRLARPADSAFADAIREDAGRFTSSLQYFQFLDKYARWDETRKRRETWRECCDRVMRFFRSRPQLEAITPAEWDAMDSYLYGRKASPAMRIVQMAGAPLERCNAGAFNCSYVAIDSLVAFPESLYLLMQGSGVGFSVESEYVDHLPRVKRQKGGVPKVIDIADSTEGWCDAYRAGLEAWTTGGDVTYRYHLIRPAGSRLETKGGKSSGPDPLKGLLDFARNLFLSRQGSRLSPRDCHDLMCMTGKIVQMGGVRRASEISLSDLDDAEMRTVKSGTWWAASPWLDMANVSAVYEGRPTAVAFMEEWLALAKSGSGERGIFNRAGANKKIPKRRKKAKFGLNPCSEVILRSMQMCNLSIAVARADDTQETLEAKVIQAAIFGTIQSTLTDFRYVRAEWKKNCDEERLLGVDICGQMDCPLLRPGAPGRAELLDRLLAAVLRTNREIADRLGIPHSTACTVVKPSGNSAVFYGCSSGLHARWSMYQVRRVRINRAGPMAALMLDAGVPHAVDPMNDTLLVFDFLPDPSPPGTPTRNDMTASEQFANWLVWKERWAEHSVSCTIYVGEDEWLSLGAEVYENFDRIVGLSFLPRDSGTYQLAPNEELTKEDYEARLAAFPRIDWSRLSHFETEDTTTSAQELACAGGNCEM